MYEQPGQLVPVDRLRKNKKVMAMERMRRRDHHANNDNNYLTRDQQEKLETVDLSGRNLVSLVSISLPLNLGIISKLDLSNNNLQMIPESLIARMLNLVALDVHSNQLRSLPNSIGCLSKLKVLNVAGNYLELLPKTIENCRSLEELHANFNQLIKLPDTIGFELTNLKKLIVGSNKLVSLPSSMSHLTALRHLDARLNWLQSLPDDLENLTDLQVLNLSQNFHHLKSLPYSIGLLLSLIELDISYNTIAVLPDSMGCLGKLKKLKVEGNPLVSPPVEVVQKGLDEVKLYLSHKMNNNHLSPRDDKNNNKKKKSWVGKLVKYGTFNTRCTSFEEGIDGYKMGEGHRSVSYISSRNIAVFSPWRIFSPKHDSSR